MRHPAPLLAHGQHDSEAGPSADHLIVSFRGFFQRIAFDHGANTYSKLNCNVSSESLAVPEGHPRTVLRAKMSCRGVMVRGSGAGADDDQFSVRPQSIDQGRDCLRIGRGGQNHAARRPGLAKRRRAAGIGIDVMVSAQFLGQCFFVPAAADRDRAKTHLARVLNAQVTQAADALHRHQFAGPSLRHGASS